MRCPQCDHDIPSDATFCGSCGEPLGGRAASGNSAALRFCVSCGRSIDFNANVCPYCGHDFRYVPEKTKYAPISSGMRILYYVLSFFVGIAGIVIGAIYLSRPDPDYRHVGKICIIIGVFSTFIMPTILALILYIAVLRF